MSLRAGGGLPAVNTTMESAARDSLEAVLASHVGPGAAPGAVALVARGDEVEVRAVGSLDLEGSAPMARDSIFRIASITKPITAAAVLMLVEEGRIALDDPVDRGCPSWPSRRWCARPAAPVDDVVPANRAITVADLLSSRAGYGFPSDFSLPAVQALLALRAGPRPAALPGPDGWLAALAQIPLLHQPGEAGSTTPARPCRASWSPGRRAGRCRTFLAERVFEPLGMADTAFEVPAASATGSPATTGRADGGLELADDAGRSVEHACRRSRWAPAAWLGTVDDWLAFARMLLAGARRRRPSAAVGRRRCSR